MDLGALISQQSAALMRITIKDTLDRPPRAAQESGGRAG